MIKCGAARVDIMHPSQWPNASSDIQRPAQRHLFPRHWVSMSLNKTSSTWCLLCFASAELARFTNCQNRDETGMRTPCESTSAPAFCTRAKPTLRQVVCVCVQSLAYVWLARGHSKQILHNPGIFIWWCSYPTAPPKKKEKQHTKKKEKHTQKWNIITM